MMSFRTGGRVFIHPLGAGAFKGQLGAYGRVWGPGARGPGARGGGLRAWGALSGWGPNALGGLGLGGAGTFFGGRRIVLPASAHQQCCRYDALV